MLFLVMPYICHVSSPCFMKRLLLVISLIFTVLLSSCVPYQDTIYLQEKDITTSDSLQVMTEQQKPYRVQINDILSIRVKALDQETVSILNPIGDEGLGADSSERAYFDGFTVDLHGNIRVPTLGEINVLGRTVEAIQELLETRLLKEQFKAASNIFVTVKLSGFRFSTMGELGSTGTQTLFQERVTIFEAIANSGEIPVTGDRKDVLIIRQYPQGQQIHHLDLTDIAVINSPYYYVQPNDMIYVKPLKQKSWGTGTSGKETLASVLAILSVITTTLLLINRI